jgi:4'-phosphopantetheinyl transferase
MNYQEHVDLWYVFFNHIDDLALLGRYRELLTDDERGQERRFHFSADRRRYLVTRALVRTTLSHYTSIPPQAWTFLTNKYGRPYVGNDDKLAKSLSFSIAHTNSLIVLAVTFDDMVGVDVENILRPAALDVAGRFFAEAEVTALKALPASLRCTRFFEYWTFKEAYVKARGMGLSLPLDQFGFRFESDDRVGFFISPEIGDVPSRWEFWQIRPSAEYVVALCVERPRGSRRVLRMKKVVPLSMEESVNYRVLLSSE